jgi:hypothetical protein
MSHAICTHGNRVNFWLLMVGSQIANLTPDHSFGHNLCFRCPNEQCEPILDIHVPRAFQCYKEWYKPLSFDPWHCSLKFHESTGTTSPKVGVVLGVWGFTPSHFPTLPGVCDVTPGFSLGLYPCNPFALVASRKPRLRHLGYLQCQKYPKRKTTWDLGAPVVLLHKKNTWPWWQGVQDCRRWIPP